MRRCAEIEYYNNGGNRRMSQQNTTDILEHIDAIRKSEEQIREHIHALIENGYSIYDIAKTTEHTVDWVRQRR